MDTEMTSQREPEQSDVDSGILSARHLYQHDPLLVLLKDKLHLGTPWIVAGGSVLGGGVAFLFISLSKSGFRPSVSLGDALDLLLVTLVIALSLLIYLLLPASMVSVFNTLSTNGVIGPPRQERVQSMSYAHFVDHMVTWAASRWWSIVIVLLNILFLLYVILIANPQFLLLPPVRLLVVSVIAFLFSYLYAFVFLRLILLAIFLNRLFFLFSIRVRPLHPDGSGGLAALSQLGWMSAALALVVTLTDFELAVLLSAPPSPLEIIDATGSYLILIIIVAIVWLALPHHVMLQARNEHLQPLTEEYERVLLETRPAADEETTQIVAGTARLSALKQRYELVRDTFPAWPIQIVEMRRLAVALLLPVLISLLPALLNVFTKK